MIRFQPKKILVPTDFSETSNAALAQARSLKEKFGSKVTVLHAEQIEVPPYFTRAQVESLTEQRSSVLDRASQYVREQAREVLDFEPEIIVTSGPPIPNILKATEEREFDMVVMGTHGRSGMERFWLGSVTERVLRRSRRPVLAVRSDSRFQFDKILAGVSSQDKGGEVLAIAVSLAEAFQARLSVVHASDGERMAETCPGVTDDFRKRCTIEETVVPGNPAENILRVARDVVPDVIVMGARRRISVLGEFTSTTTDRVMRAAETSLLVVPLENIEE